ncbi:MAG: hypothetical protein AB8B51_20405 [Sedimentitalea sp.]
MATAGKTKEKPASKQDEATQQETLETPVITAETDLDLIAQKHKAKRDRVAKANKITFILGSGVRKFITEEARASGMDIAPFMQMLAENHVLANAPDDNPLVKRLSAQRAAYDLVVALARKTDASGDFDEHFILTVMQKAWADPVFKDLYNTAIEAESDNPKVIARAKAPMNQHLGRLIKRAAGARSKRNEAGRIQRAQVQNEMISTYTLLEKPE